MKPLFERFYLMKYAEMKTAEGVDKITLRGTRIQAHLTAFHQLTTVEQTYVNCEDRAVEAVYTFPLPENAAIYGFEIHTAEKCLRGEIEGRDEALHRYQDAMMAGDGAYLLEQHRPDVFSAWVGNLKPNQAVTVRLKYVVPLTIHEREIRVYFPTTIAPRFAGQSQLASIDGMIDAEILNPPHPLYVPYGVSLDVNVDLGRPPVSITSPSHPIECQNAGDQIPRVRFVRESMDMDRDIVLEIKLDRELEPRAVSSAEKDGETFVSLTFIPEFEGELEQELAPRETIFVLDCSGSMQGDSIEQAKAALALCLRSLCDGDSFNICRFGSTFEWMSPDAVPYNAKTLAKALRYAQNTEASLGGTELLETLKSLMDMPVRTGRIRDVVLLTDGQVSDEPAVIALAQAHSDTQRFFTFGIGSAASHHLIQGLARATSGAAESIFPGERIEDKVLRTFSRMASPMVTDVGLAWEGSKVELAAPVRTCFFEGDPLTIFGCCSGKLPSAAALSCKMRGQLYEWKVVIPPAVETGDQLPLAQLWARERIDNLRVRFGQHDLLANRLHGHSNAEHDIISLAIRYGVLTPETTFVAIEERQGESKVTEKASLKRIPLMLANGWHGMESADLMDVLPRYCHNPNSSTRFRKFSKVVDRMLSLKINRGPVDQESPSPLDNALAAMLELLNHQGADGSFDLTDATIISLSSHIPQLPKWRSDLPTVLREVRGDGEMASERIILDTIAAIVVCREVFAEQHDLWKRAERKAKQFLAAHLNDPESLLRVAVASAGPLGAS